MRAGQPWKQTQSQSLLRLGQAARGHGPGPPPRPRGGEAAPGEPGGGAAAADERAAEPQDQEGEPRGSEGRRMCRASSSSVQRHRASISASEVHVDRRGLRRWQFHGDKRGHEAQEEHRAGEEQLLREQRPGALRIPNGPAVLSKGPTSEEHELQHERCLPREKHIDPPEQRRQKDVIHLLRGDHRQLLLQPLDGPGHRCELGRGRHADGLPGDDVHGGNAGRLHGCGGTLLHGVSRRAPA
mmetsp:Transcript_102220/g.298101  ORF Transcript_102220/g.298101 Transcript_102220/m.298101 type:complete len:241 (-) Transcript_102220:1260-1982(-)